MDSLPAMLYPFQRKYDTWSDVIWPLIVLFVLSVGAATRLSAYGWVVVMLAAVVGFGILCFVRWLVIRISAGDEYVPASAASMIDLHGLMACVIITGAWLLWWIQA